MTLLEALQLIGYSLGAMLPLWLGYLLARQRLGMVPIQRLLIALALCMIGWHGGNLIITLRSLLGLSHAEWAPALRLANTIAVISITASYSLLLHVHLHLWAHAHSRNLTKIERVRIYLSYLPCLFLFITVPRIWLGTYQPMILKLSSFVLPFAVWAAYSLTVCAITELLVARLSTSTSELRILRTLAGSFVVIAALILAALGFGLGRGTTAGLYLQTFANLGSLLPSALLAYYIYRYRYLELIIKESLVVATFAAVVLAVYVYGIRRIGDWANARYGVRAGVVEAILILGLTLSAAPLRGWLEKWFRGLFERETALYRDVVTRVSAPQFGQYRQLSDLLAYIESQVASALSLRRVKIIPRVSEAEPTWRDTDSVLARKLMGKAEASDTSIFEDVSELDDGRYNIAFALRREDRISGMLLIECATGALTPDVRATLEVLAGQIAVAIDDWRLVEENVRLERKLAEGERLAALGQMAATVAHEVRNPLSAIKSIAQVMSEDDNLNAAYTRDLSLIVSETDRLNNSVTQLLSFAGKTPLTATPATAEEIIRGVAALFRAESEERHVKLTVAATANSVLDGVQTAAARDALSNLVLNALQATSAGGEVTLQSSVTDDELRFTVADNGPGIPQDVRARIWEPFFTTRQRGTGLGLAIVRKRMQEAGGSAKLLASQNGDGAKFELRLPLQNRAR